MTHTPLNSLREALRAAGAYAVTGETESPEEVIRRCRAVIAGGAGVIQLRQKSWGAQTRLEVACRLVEVCRAAGVLLIINDDLAVALASGADGVHLGQDDLPLGEARRLAGWSLLIGRSTHSVEQAAAAEAEGADYIGVGPLHATPTKAGRPPIGAETARAMVAAVRIPTFVIGGMDAANVGEAMSTGASGFAVVRAAWDAADPAAALTQLLSRGGLTPRRAGLPPRLRDLGERGFLDLILPRLPASDLVVGPGDDAAVVRARQADLVTTTDTFVEGVHFDFDLHSPRDLGWRALALSAADVLAMGGEPHEALLALAAPARYPVDALEQLLTGLGACATDLGLAVAGGETTATPGPLTLTVTVTGSVSGGILRRDGARAGDILCVTGVLGRPAAALRAMRSREPVAPAWQRAFSQPHPRRGAVLADAGIAAAGDISDGLAAEARRLAAAAHCGVRLELERVPLDDEACERWGRLEALRLALGGGEEEELFFTVPPEMLESVRAALEREGMRAIPVGSITLGRGLAVVGEEAREMAATGYEHFR